MLEFDTLYTHLTCLEADPATAFGQSKQSRDLQRELFETQLTQELQMDFSALWEAERVFRRLELEAAYRFGIREGARVESILHCKA